MICPTKWLPEITKQVYDVYVTMAPRPENQNLERTPSPLVNQYKYWKWQFSSLIYPLKMVILHSYVNVYQKVTPAPVSIICLLEGEPAAEAPRPLQGAGPVEGHVGDPQRLQELVYM